MAQAAQSKLSDAAWLKAPGLIAVFKALATTGKTSRAVGGAVRNTLLGAPIDDVDIATEATPDQVMVAARKAGIAAHPTGLAHGTVTLVALGQTYEVTTLRRDVATDGRHATVAFTDDWAEDASRRDFTINALYCDADGALFDPLGGAADLNPPRVRFIGDARARIREDYLRILRFFRFSARYTSDGADADGLAACGAERAGLQQISAERIRVELLKLLITPRAASMCRIMQAHGFLAGQLGLAPAPQRLQQLISLEMKLDRKPDALSRLAALAVTAHTDVGALARRLKMSAEERKRLQAIASSLGALRDAPDPSAVRRRIYQRGAEQARETLLAAWASASQPADEIAWLSAYALAESWAAPICPISGQDVITLGVPAGPDVGRLLGKLETWWIASDFIPDRAACLKHLSALANSD